MNLIPIQSEAEQDVALRDRIVAQAAMATQQLAMQLRQLSQQFWALPTERLLAVLNADVAKTLAIFAANTQLATDLNANLDALASPQFAMRAPVSMGRNDIVFDGSAFVLVAPPATPAESPSPVESPPVDPSAGPSFPL